MNSFSKICVLFNRGSGFIKNCGKDELSEIIKKMKSLADICDEFDFRQIEGEEIKDMIANSMDNEPDLVVAAGGDGTVSAVAQAAVKYGFTLGVIPLGTFNNFSKDAGIPQQWKDAVEIIKNGSAKKIDAAEVNGNVFINNSSIGLYPKSVKERDRHMKLGHGKFVSMAVGLYRIFSRFPLHKVRIETAEGLQQYKTAFVFVGNNEYEVDLLNLGRRLNLNSGKLCLYLSGCKNRLCMIKMAILSLFGKLDQGKDFIYTTAEQVTVYTKRKKMRIAADGETFKTESPIRYKIIKNTLEIMLSKD